MKTIPDRERALRRDVHAIALGVLVIALAGSCIAHAQEEPAESVWTVTPLDVDVVLRPEEEAR
jgi:hypothetical protein